MKRVMFLLFLMQRNWISSQPLTNEDVRKTRQLNFDECCPCPIADNVKDSNVMSTNKVPSECPCRAADSDTASSLFTPTLRAAQTFVRPFENRDEPKPLLNPEVGLASSVLETLREVTDQEYEEALARDVARSALQEMDSDADEIPVSESMNVFNDILSPKNKEAIDVISQASHNDETRCIHPTLSRVNEFGPFEIQPRRNLLKDFFIYKPAGLQDNIFDMENSPSDIQEQILPSKNKLLDDIKFKTNILKSKLFSNNKELLQKRVTGESFDIIFNNKPKNKTPAWKFVAPLDNLKSSKLFNSNSIPPIPEKTKDFKLLNNNIFKDNVKNYKKVEITTPLKPQQNNKYVTDEILSSERINFPLSRPTPNVQRLKNTKDMDSKGDTSIINSVLSERDDCNLKKENMLPVVITTEKTIVNEANTSNFPIFISPHSRTEILDTIPSPSETIADENQLLNPVDSSGHEDSSSSSSSIENLSEINITPNPEQTSYNTYDNINPSSLVKPTDEQDTSNNLSIEENLEEADIPETACTTQNSKSEINSFYSVSTLAPITIDTDVFNLPITQNEEENINFINLEGNNRKEDSAQSIDNILDKNKGMFPNIKDDIIKTFENLKNINGKLQDKIKLNVQDALQLTDIKNNIVLKDTPTQNPILATPHKSNSESSNTPLNTLSSQELQKMSDSILTLSAVNQNSDPHLKSSVKEVFDSNGQQSETISCVTPLQVYNNKASEEKALNSNNKEIIRSGNENQQRFRNINSGMTYRDTDNKPRMLIPTQVSSLSSIEPVSFDDHEMAAEASEPKPQRNKKIGLDNTRNLKQNLVVQPNTELDEFGRSVSNVNNFFDNVKSAVSNLFSQTSENNFRQTEDSEYRTDNNYKMIKQNSASDLEKSKLQKNSNFFKSPQSVQTDADTVERIKSNWNPYKFRVAVSDSFYVNPIVTLDEIVDKSSRTLGNQRNLLPKTYSTKATTYNSNTNAENENMRSLFRESVHSNPNSESTVVSTNVVKNNYRSPGSKNLNSLKDITETALQNIHKSLGNSLRAVPSKENHRLLSNIANDNLLETMANKRNEFNEKLQAINLDFNDRLSSLSHKMADSIFPSLNSQPLQRRIITKSRSDLKNKQDLEYLKRKNVSPDLRSALPRSKINGQLKQSNDNLSVPKQLKKTLIRDHLPDLHRPPLHEKLITQARMLPKSSPVNKSLKTETNNFKPKFKDNTIISATTSTRPKPQISGIKVPQTMKKETILAPKISAPLEKKYYTSRLQSREPHSLGSENIMSRVLLDKKTDNEKSTISSDDSDSDPIINSFKDVKASKQEVAKNVALSKLREAIKAKMTNNDSNKNYNNLKSNLDIIPSASENVNREIEESLKQNVQYKCKMLCTKEK